MQSTFDSKFKFDSKSIFEIKIQFLKLGHFQNQKLKISVSKFNFPNKKSLFDSKFVFDLKIQFAIKKNNFRTKSSNFRDPRILSSKKISD